jgi:hypothetical protein
MLVVKVMRYIWRYGVEVWEKRSIATDFLLQCHQKLAISRGKDGLKERDIPLNISTRDIQKDFNVTTE